MLQTLPLFVSLLVQAAPAAPTTPTTTAPPATAAPAAGAEPAPKDKAQVLLTEGSALYKLADYAGALKKFEAAYAIYPSPKLLFNIAQANRQLGKSVEAVEAFETFLVQAPDAGPDLVAEARQSLSELKPKLGQIRVDADSGAQVMVDERSIGFTPIARLIWVVPGSHKVAVNHPSFAPWMTDLTVGAGEIRLVTPKLLPPAVAAPAGTPGGPAAAAGATPSPLPPFEPARAGRPWYFWAAAAATVAFTAGAVIAGLSANGKYSDLENGCNQTPKGCTDAEIDAVKSRAMLANTLFILAGAAAVTTGVTFFVGNREAGASVALRF